MGRGGILRIQGLRRISLSSRMSERYCTERSTSGVARRQGDVLGFIGVVLSGDEAALGVEAAKASKVLGKESTCSSSGMIVTRPSSRV